MKYFFVEYAHVYSILYTKYLVSGTVNSGYGHFVKQGYNLAGTCYGYYGGGGFIDDKETRDIPMQGISRVPGGYLKSKQGR